MKTFSQISERSLLSEVKTLSLRNMTDALDYSLIQGNPYFSSDFKESTVHLNDGNFSTALLRYDIYQDEMEFVDNEKIMWLNKKEVKFIRHSSEMIIVSNTMSKPANLTYFFVKNTGRYNLLLKKSVEYYGSGPAKAYSQAEPARFLPGKDELYLQQKKMPAQRIKTRKDLFAFFTNNDEALNFIKKEKVKANDQDDLQKLVDFLNNITEPEKSP